MSDNPFLPLDALDDWEAAREASASEPVVIFKHSSMCPTSARANDEMQDLAEGDTAVYRVVVQQARDVSNAIEEALGVRHETPQVIVLSNGSPTFDASHHRVKADAVREAAA